MTADVSEAALRRAIVLVCRRLYERGLIASGDGNVSVRLSSGDILITPSGIAKPDVCVDDLVTVSPLGQSVAGRGEPSSELGMHLRIYERRPDVRAVVHAHPPAATAFAVAGDDLMLPVLPEVVLHTAGVPLVPYATPGTPAVADALDPFLPHHDAFLMANHGATTVGPSLSVAHQRMESVEHGARIILGARLLGRVTPLGAADVAALRERRHRGTDAGTRPSTEP